MSSPAGDWFPWLPVDSGAPDCFMVPAHRGVTVTTIIEDDSDGSDCGFTFHYGCKRCCAEWWESAEERAERLGLTVDQVIESAGGA